MMSKSTWWKAATFLWAAAMMHWGLAQTWGQGQYLVCPDVRVNDPRGPDQTPGNDDDDDGDPPSSDKPQRDAGVAALITQEGPVLVAAFSDRSLRGVPATSTGYTVGFAFSNDLGATWVDTHDLVRGPTGDCESGLCPPSNSPWPGEWLPQQKRPSVGIGGNGTVYMVGEEWEPSGSARRTRVWLARSVDQGATWTVTAVVWDQSPVRLRWASVSADPRPLAEGGNRVYVTWVRHDFAPFEMQSVWLAVSHDGGENFLSPVQISTAMDVGNRLVTCSSAVGLDGTLYLVWFEPERGGQYSEEPPLYLDRYAMRRSFDGGANFDPALQYDPRELVTLWGLSRPRFNECCAPSVCCFYFSDTTTYGLDSASIAVGKRRGQTGHVYVAYARNDMCPPEEETPDANVCVRRSTDRGETWDCSVVVHNAERFPPGHEPYSFGQPSQYCPAVAVSQAGQVAVSFYNAVDDVRFTDETPLIANQSYLEYFAYAVDDVAPDCLTFEPEFAVSSQSSLPRVTDDFGSGDFCHRVGMTEYAAMGAYGRTFHPMWISLRNWVTAAQDPDWVSKRLATWDFVGDVYTTRVEVLHPAPPDFEADCDVDLDDFSVLAACYGGSNNPVPPACVPADLDHDGDVDMDDFGIFAGYYTAALGGCVGAGEPCGGAGAGGGSSAPEQSGGDFPSWLLENPEIRELYEALRHYCEEQGLPFT